MCSRPLARSVSPPLGLKHDATLDRGIQRLRGRSREKPFCIEDGPRLPHASSSVGTTWPEKAKAAVSRRFISKQGERPLFWAGPRQQAQQARGVVAGAGLANPKAAPVARGARAAGTYRRQRFRYRPLAAGEGLAVQQIEPHQPNRRATATKVQGCKPGKSGRRATQQGTGPHPGQPADSTDSAGQNWRLALPCWPALAGTFQPPCKPSDRQRPRGKQGPRLCQQTSSKHERLESGGLERGSGAGGELLAHQRRPRSASLQPQAGHGQS